MIGCQTCLDPVYLGVPLKIMVAKVADMYKQKKTGIPLKRHRLIGCQTCLDPVYLGVPLKIMVAKVADKYKQKKWIYLRKFIG